MDVALSSGQTMPALSYALALLLAFLLAFSPACTAETVAAPVSGQAPGVDVAAPVAGVSDRGADPAVLALVAPGALPCAGALVAPDVLLTALHCVQVAGASARCPRGAGALPQLVRPSSLQVLAGDSTAAATETAHGREIVAPSPPDPCEGDVALLLLDQAIDGVAPLLVRSVGAAEGDHVRTVGFRLEAGEGAVRFVRDHVPVVTSSQTSLAVDEAPCPGGCGGPALVEATAEIVGVASRWVAPAGAAAGHDAYVRADAFLALIESALARSAASSTAGAASKLAKPKKGAVDVGAGCASGADCAAGICVTEATQRYCTRSCGPHDSCPAHFRCDKSASAVVVCVET